MSQLMCLLCLSWYLLLFCFFERCLRAVGWLFPDIFLIIVQISSVGRNKLVDSFGNFPWFPLIILVFALKNLKAMRLFVIGSLLNF